MKVRAIGPGYYNHARRKEGDEFEISSEKEFSGKWMEKILPKFEAKSEKKS